MELVTGRAGSPHITAQQDRQKHQGIWGDGAYILATGNQLEPEVQSSNKILIKDGALMFQGALFSVKVGTTDEITINNGNQGMQRKDLVVARYTYDSSQNIESAEWVVIQGTPAASNPVAPTGTDGDIQAGDSTVDCPFMIVNLNGINVTGVDIIPEKIPTLPDLIGNLSDVQSRTELKTISTGFTWNISLTNKFVVAYKVGRLVYIQGHLRHSSGISSSPEIKFLTLPASLKPISQYVSCSVYNSSNSKDIPTYCIVHQDDRGVYLFTPGTSSGTAYIHFSATYITSA